MNLRRNIMLLSLTILILTTSQSISKAEVINRVLAYVGDKIITVYDIINLDPKQYRTLLAIPNEEERKVAITQFTDQAVDFLINQYVVEISARREGIKVNDSEVDLAIADILQRNNIDNKTLEESLAKEGMTMAKYRFQLKNEILNTRVRGAILLPKLIVVDKDIRDIIDTNSEEHNLSDKYEVAMIVTPDDTLMKEVAIALKKGGSFEDVAKKYSIDATAVNGGYMGFIEVSHLSGEMKNAILKSKLGSVSKPFTFNNQRGIFKVISFKSKYDIDEETKEELSNIAREKLFLTVFNKWLERNKETIVIMKNKELN